MTRGCCELDAVSLVTHRVVFRAVQTPRICIAPEGWRFHAWFPIYPFVGEGNLHLVSLHFYFVVAPLCLQTLPAQHLPTRDEPLWVTDGWNFTWLRAQHDLSVSFRNNQVLMSCWRVQRKLTRIWDNKEGQTVQLAPQQYSCATVTVHESTLSCMSEDKLTLQKVLSGFKFLFLFLLDPISSG